MIKLLQSNASAGIFCQPAELERVNELLADRNNLFWLDLLAPGEAEIKRVAEEFNFHPLAVEDASSSHQRPKLEEYDNFLFIVFYTISLDKNRQTKDAVTVQELDLFIGPNYLVTLHQQPIKELDEAEKRWERNSQQIEQGVGTLVYSVLDTIVDNYYPVVDAIVEEAEELEDIIFATMDRTGQHHIASRLLGLKKLFLQVRRIIAPQRDVLNVLTNRDRTIFDEHSLMYFRDVHDHLLQVHDTLDLYRDQLSSIMDANLTVASNQLNKVMRTLTATSIILMSDSLIAGIYGMNFENMPELKWSFGYYGTLSLMAGVTFVLIMIFKYLKWI